MKGEAVSESIITPRAVDHGGWCIWQVVGPSGLLDPVDWCIWWVGGPREG